METEAPFLRWAQRVETALGNALPSASIPPQRLHAAMRHAVLGGGKVNPIAIRIERTLSTFQDWGSASALGVLLLLLVLIAGAMFVAIRGLAGKRTHHA